MKKVLVSVFVLALVTATAGPVFADPAKGSTASAYGLRSQGLIPIEPTPTARAVAPPDSTDGPNDVLRLPVAPLTIDTVASAFAQTARDSVLQTTLADPRGIDEESDPTSLQDVNARGLAATAGVTLVVDGALDPVTAAVFDIINESLVGVSAVRAEAVAKCVNDRPQFDTGYDLVAAGVAGTKIDLVDQVVVLVTGLLGAPGSPIPAGTPLSSILRVETPENGATVTRTDTGIAVTGLRVISDLLGLRIDIAHAEATMPIDCGFDCSDRRDNDGDGKIDFGPDPGCDSPYDDDERDAIRTGPPARALAATGGDMGTWPLVAFGMLGAAVIVRRMTLRSSRKPS